MGPKKPDTIPSRADRFCEAIDQCEKALASGDEEAIKDALIKVGRVAWNLSPQILVGLSPPSPHIFYERHCNQEGVDTH